MAPDAGFRTTRWTLVQAAAHDDPARAREALEALCAAYWYPLYVYVRRRGHDADQAQDLTQAFFARLIEKGDVADADRRKGKFRAFLLASLKHFLSNARDAARARKRGGVAVHVPIDAAAAESRLAPQLAHGESPERAFERQWAMTVLANTVAALRAEAESQGALEKFEALKGTLTGDGGAPLAEIGRDLGMSEGAVKVAAHRLRRRYRELLRAEILQTVSRPGDVDAELRHLLAALGP